jgi:hypothetical protein
MTPAARLASYEAIVRKYLRARAENDARTLGLIRDLADGLGDAVLAIMLETAADRANKDNRHERSDRD